ncbi:hypothetical protein ARMGADRAFT_1019829 [Armillaria gallica]|uniref:Uncharacterized protein n=1 Tax=Armillaria gallica TaxID=47427 RepID=A0A2H3CGC0_ARMGA|nr:hypothetical protein ARMGADRAFT_1019829 [Armillaria gallica]
MTVDDLLRWADRYDIEPDGHWFERLDATRAEILHRLPWKIEWPYAHLFVRHRTEKYSDSSPGSATCFLLGTNATRERWITPRTKR